MCDKPQHITSHKQTKTELQNQQERSTKLLNPKDNEIITYRRKKTKARTLFCIIEVFGNSSSLLDEKGALQTSDKLTSMRLAAPEEGTGRPNSRVRSEPLSLELGETRE